MRYAENTAVSSERSKAEIEETLRRYGADQFMSGWKDEQAAIQFRVKNKMVRFILPLPSTESFQTVVKWGKERKASPEVAAQNWEQACRQRWRALALAIKAKLEAVECGITTFEEEFFAHLVVPGQHGKTVGQLVMAQLDDAYATGEISSTWVGRLMALGDPIKIASLGFDSLHADDDGNVVLKFKLPASECAAAGLFPVMREIEFSAVFTPKGVRKSEPTL